MPRAFVSSAYVVAVLATIVVFSTGRNVNSPPQMTTDASQPATLVDRAEPSEDADDVSLPKFAAEFAYSDLARRLDQLADELEALDRTDSAASLRTVSLQLQQDMEQLAPAWRRTNAEEPMTFGGVTLYR